MQKTEVVMCDRNAEQSAVWSYSWEWGENGVCSSESRNLLEQTARNLKRRISFAPLINLGEPPLERTERASLKGSIYALEEEIAELKARGVAMYTELGTLRSDGRLLALREKEANRQVEDLKARLEMAQSACIAAQRDADSAKEELAIVQSLLSEQAQR